MQTVPVKINGEFDILLTEHRAARQNWESETGWEKLRLQSLHKHIKKGDIVYYLGAEQGEMPALCSMWGAEVVLFEPNYKSWPTIKAVWEANKLKPPLRCFAGFASEVTQRNPSTANGSIYDGVGWKIGADGWPMYADGEVGLEHGFNHLAEEATAHPQITVDDFVLESGIIPTIITMDCEGSEGKILRGAINTLQKYKPKLWLSIHPQFMIDMYKETAEDLRAWLISLGYKETILDNRHELHTLYE